MSDTNMVQPKQNLSNEKAPIPKKRANNAPNAEKIGRTELLNISSWLVDNLKGRLSKARFIEQSGDPIKLQYCRVLVQAIQAHNSVLKDEQLDNIETRLQALEGCNPHPEGDV